MDLYAMQEPKYWCVITVINCFHINIGFTP